MAKKWVQEARANIIATRKTLKNDRISEYKYTRDVLGTVYGNLGTTLGGGRAALTAEQKRLMGSLAALKQNQDRISAKNSTQARTQVSRLYGSSTLGAVAPSVRTVDTMGEAGTRAVAAQVASGGILARGNMAAYTTLQQGARMAEAGADAQLADALAYRAKDDATLVAEQQLALQQQRFEIAKMREQNRLDLKNYEAKLALEDEKNGTGGQLTALSGSAAGAAPGLWNQYMTWLGADGQPVADQASVHQNDEGQWVDGDDNPVHAPTPGEAVQRYVQDNAITDPNEIALISALARAMYTAGAGHAPGGYTGSPESLTTAITQQLSIMYPDAGKYSDEVAGIVSASLSNEMLKAGYAPPPEPERDPDEEGGFWRQGPLDWFTDIFWPKREYPDFQKYMEEANQ